jgi:branched-chain amino acid transport system ATP-binding protein
LILEAVGIKKYYDGFCALDGLSIGIREGEFVSIIGPNGAGKTTLINVLTGLLKPDAGRVLFRGKDIAGIGPEKISKLGIARSFQLINIFPELSVIETIVAAVLSKQGKGMKLFGNLARDKQVYGEALEVAELFGFKNELGQKSKNLPQGSKKLLDVASAFALRPEVILLDEPTSGVSTKDKNKILKVMVEASKKIGIKTIFQVEHDMDIVFSYSDRVLVIQQGKILADGLPIEVQKNENVICTVVGQKECFKTFERIMKKE